MHSPFFSNKANIEKKKKKKRSQLRTLIIWLQQYVRSDWLLSGHYFLVMTEHYQVGVQGMYNMTAILIVLRKI